MNDLQICCGNIEANYLMNFYWPFDEIKRYLKSRFINIDNLWKISFAECEQNLLREQSCEIQVYSSVNFPGARPTISKFESLKICPPNKFHFWSAAMSINAFRGSGNYPTDPFTVLEHQHPWHDVHKFHAIRRYPYLEALEWWNGRSGTGRCVPRFYGLIFKVTISTFFRRFQGEFPSKFPLSSKSGPMLETLGPSPS